MTAVVDAPADADHPAGRRSVTRPPALVVFAIVGALIGVGLRVYLYRTPSLVSLDSDEAISGLMASSFLRGDLNVFFWGQYYGGTLEPGLAALAFAVFGASTTVLKLVSTTLAAGAAVLAWRVGRRAVNETVGVVAGVLMWVWPATYIWWGAKARGFYWVATILGLLLMLLAMRIVDVVRAQPMDRRALVLHAVGFGFVLGLGWWTTPQIALYAIPVCVWLAVVARRAWRMVPVVIGAALVGSIPWWYANLRNGFRSLDVPPTQAGLSYFDRLRIMSIDGLPVAFGGKVPQAATWVTAGQFWSVLVVTVVVAGAVVLARRGFSTPAGLVVLTLGLYLFVNAVSPLSNYVDDGRYLVYALPLFTIAIAAVTCAWGPRATPVLVSVVLLLAAGNSAYVLREEAAIPWAKASASTASLQRELRARDIRTAVADYWIAYRVTFETGERTIVASSGVDRQPEYSRIAGPRPDAIITVAGSADDERTRVALERTGAPFQRFVADSFAVYDTRSPVPG